uniref:Uncharacterized protein n=1 Tax=uncultured Rhodobacterales bacterium HF4000_03E16 TaxID=710785 RepID=E0XV93_9RHOB|nr:hypothetical protein [uncultured Rhodobacterales bacterium HF4000_03E16]
MVHLGVHVAVEPIFAAIGNVPACRRLLIGQGDAHHRLDRLEAVFPRHHQPQRCAVLIGDVATIDAGGHDGERMHRLVQPQPLDIRPLQHRIFLAPHLVRAIERLEGHVFRARLHPGQVQQVGQLEAVPGHHHRPGLDAAKAIDALFDGHPGHDVLEGKLAGIVDHAIDFHAPRIGGERMGIARRVILAGAEFVEVVVGGDVVPFIGLERILLRHRRAGEAGEADAGGPSHELPPIKVDGFRRDVGLGQRVLPAIGHVVPFGLSRRVRVQAPRLAFYLAAVGVWTKPRLLNSAWPFCNVWRPGVPGLSH